MYIFKRLIKLLYYKCKSKRLKLYYSSNIGSFYSQFEGYNSIGRRSFFYGKMGYASYIGNDTQFSAVVGKFCSIGNEVRTITGRHPLYTCISTHPCFFSTAKQAGFTYVEKDYFDEATNLVEVGNDVWIGDRVTILGGVRIGDGSVIGAGSVVTKDIEPYAVVAGSPARMIGKRFSDDRIEELSSISWWNKDVLWLKENAPIFNDIDVFFETVDR